MSAFDKPGRAQGRLPNRRRNHRKRWQFPARESRMLLQGAPWRGVRAAEGAGFENRCATKVAPWVRIPPSPLPGRAVGQAILLGEAPCALQFGAGKCLSPGRRPFSGQAGLAGVRFVRVLYGMSYRRKPRPEHSAKRGGMCCRSATHHRPPGPVFRVADGRSFKAFFNLTGLCEWSNLK